MNDQGPDDSEREDLKAELVKEKALWEAEKAKLDAAKAEQIELIVAFFSAFNHDFIRQFCIGTGVDAESLIQKLPPTADALKPNGLNRHVKKLESEAQELTIEETRVCQRMCQAHEMMFESLWESLKKKFPNLPEFAD